MKNKLLLLSSIFGASVSFFAQVGINTTTPTEKLDVNGTLRVRSLVNDGAVGIYTTGTNTNSGASPTQTFTADKPMVADTNGVFGITTKANLVPNRTVTGLATDVADTSTAMFVVKRFLLYDDIGTTIGRYHPASTAATVAGIFNGDTTMSVNNWQAIISNVSYKFLSGTANTGDQFIQDNYFNYRLKGAAGGTWKIVGDIINLKEQAYVDVLFIKSSFVAAEDRSL